MDGQFLLSTNPKYSDSESITVAANPSWPWLPASKFRSHNRQNPKFREASGKNSFKWEKLHILMLFTSDSLNIFMG